jgi:hypothetical protein
MAYAFIDKAENSSASASTLTIGTANIAANPTAGNLLFYVVNYTSGSLQTATVSDTLLNAFVEIGSHFDSTVGDAFHWGYSKNISGGSADAFLATMGTLVADPAIYVAEYSGLDPSAPYTTGEKAVQDQSNPGTGADAVSSGNTPTLSAQPAVLIGLCLQANNGGALSAGTGFTSRGGIWTYGGVPLFGFVEDKRLTATTAVASTFTSSSGNADNFTTLAAVFKETVAAATGVAVNLIYVNP